MKKILVVDDCSSIRAYLKKLAWLWNFDVVATDDGNVALEEMKKDDAPQILFIDWMMPIMDGMELIKRIREQQTDKMRYIISHDCKKRSQRHRRRFRNGGG